MTAALGAVCIAGALIVTSALTAAAQPTALNGPRAISAASPYPAGCGLNMSEAGLGDGFEDTETEPSLAVDPNDPHHLIAAWMQDEYQGYVAVTSKTGGARWNEPVIVPGISACTGSEYEIAADPWLSIGPDGTSYLAGISLDMRDSVPALPFRSRLQVNRSTDGGASWSEPAVVVAGDGRLHDKPALLADPARHGHAYIVWTEFLTALGPPPDGIHFSRTTDGGATWSRGLRLDFPMPQGAVPHGALVNILPDGTLFVTTTMRASNAGSDPHRIYAMRSSDLGTTWSPAVIVAEFPATRGRHSTPWDAPETGEPIDAPEWAISAAVAPDATVYVTWVHARSSSSADIRMARSSDGGAAWDPPRTVASTGGRGFLPVVSVLRNGTVGLTYYDDRNDVPGDEAYSADFWFAHSHNRGATWTESHVAGPFDLQSAPMRKIPITGRFVGDYTGLVPLPGGFGAAFALAEPQSMIGATDVFFARVHTSPTGHGVPGR